jgi:hypothetical protein
MFGARTETILIYFLESELEVLHESEEPSNIGSPLVHRHSSNIGYNL